MANEQLTVYLREDIEMDLVMATLLIPEKADLHRQIRSLIKHDDQPGKPTILAVWHYHGVHPILQAELPDRPTLRRILHDLAMVLLHDPGHRTQLGTLTYLIIRMELIDLEPKEVGTTIVRLTKDQGDEAAVPCDTIKSSVTVSIILAVIITADESGRLMDNG